MTSNDSSPDHDFIVGRPLNLQMHGGSVNRAFLQEEDNRPSNTDPTYLYSPTRTENSFLQSPDNSIFSEFSQNHLIHENVDGSRHNVSNAPLSITMNVSKSPNDFVLEETASIASRDSLNPSNDFEDESVRRGFLTMLVPFMAAGLGTVGAGLLLDRVVTWEQFKAIPELVGLVPTLLGLKGNLEMTLTARLCTATNLGNMDGSRDRYRLIAGNLVVTQLQAIAVSFLASLISIAVYFFSDSNFEMMRILVLCATALLTASLASLILGTLMCLLVILSRRLNLNPDNIAAPIAASLGDITTLGLLSYISSVLYNLRTVAWLSPAIILLFISLVPLWAFCSYQNLTVRPVLITGWTPVIGAMCVSQAAGFILEKATTCYLSMAVYQPVIAGVGGNLVVVQVCRMTTYLSQRAELGSYPHEDHRTCVDPVSALLGNHYLSKTARLLLLITVPGQLLFLLVIKLSHSSNFRMTPFFIALYVTSALTQVAILLYLARCMVFFMWRRSIDPDNAAIPYLTALGDLFGIGFLAIVMLILSGLGDPSVVMDKSCLPVERMDGNLTANFFATR